MIRRLESKQEQRAVRLKLYSDDVYVIAHKAVKEVAATLSVEEIFSSADILASHLLENGISERGFIDMEVDDVREELDDERDLFPLLSVTFVKLCALRKAKPIAADIARALVHRCQEFEDFTPLLGKLSNAENSLITQKKRLDLFNYELKTLEVEGTNPDVAEQIVNSALECDKHVVKNVTMAFSIFNGKCNGKYDQQLQRLIIGYQDKVRKEEEGKNVTNNFNNPSFGAMYDVHNNENVHT